MSFIQLADASIKLARLDKPKQWYLIILLDFYEDKVMC